MQSVHTEELEQVRQLPINEEQRSQLLLEVPIRKVLFSQDWQTDPFWQLLQLLIAEEQSEQFPASTY